jgi:hypothetical protein
MGTCCLSLRQSSCCYGYLISSSGAGLACTRALQNHVTEPRLRHRTPHYTMLSCLLVVLLECSSTLVLICDQLSVQGSPSCGLGRSSSHSSRACQLPPGQHSSQAPAVKQVHKQQVSPPKRSMRLALSGLLAAPACTRINECLLGLTWHIRSDFTVADGGPCWLSAP